MPTYVYECSSCNDVFEVEQRITENALSECACGAKGTVKRLIQPVGVIFSGAGFHINDYASKTAPAKDPEKATQETEKPAEGAKTAEKSESGTGEASPRADSPAKTDG